MRMVVAEYLRECGYIVIEGSTADDVMTVLHAGTHVDTILTELKLPGNLDGFGLARWVRDNHPGIDVILTSSIRNAAQKAGDLCDDGPLEKPFHPRELVRRINLLRGRRRTMF
ncbi:MAG: response regulator [Alphaproteobacteria bacterium]|nr:response regulator [Alphaproteobacteria bacterium]